MVMTDNTEFDFVTADRNMAKAKNYRKFSMIVWCTYTFVLFFQVIMAIIFDHQGPFSILGFWYCSISYWFTLLYLSSIYELEQIFPMPFNYSPENIARLLAEFEGKLPSIRRTMIFMIISTSVYTFALLCHVIIWDFTQDEQLGSVLYIFILTSTSIVALALIHRSHSLHVPIQI